MNPPTEKSIARQANDVQVGCLDAELSEARLKCQRAEPGNGAFDHAAEINLARPSPPATLTLDQRKVRIETSPRGLDATDGHRRLQRTRSHLLDARPKFIDARHRDVTHGEQQRAGEKEQRDERPRDRKPCETQGTARMNTDARAAWTISAFSDV